jgi:peptide deformylase
MPDPVLRTKAKKVRVVDASIRKLIDNMLETMHHEGGVGLAANQVGVLQRVLVIQIPDQEPIALVNAEIGQRGGEREVEEGCLSIPGYRGLVKRSVKVSARGLDRNGKRVRIKAAEGLLAQALEHEVDHLDGVLYIDRLVSPEKLWQLEKGEPVEAGPAR